jgi:hypothetical protein
VEPDAEETREERFEFGLDCLLAGIAVKVGDARRPSHDTAGKHALPDIF